MIELIEGPLEPDTARWAAGLNDPASGRLAVICPPTVESPGRLVGAILAALGKLAGPNPRWRSEPEDLELLLAWLKGHRIERLILVHADWLPQRIATALAAHLALAGVELVALVDPGGERVLEAWTPGSRAWVTFVERETRDAAHREALAADPARHQRDPLPVLGLPLGALRLDADGPLEGPALVAYLDLAARLRRDGRTEGAVAHAAMLVLRGYAAGAERDEAIGGATRALGQAGWGLWSDGRDRRGGRLPAGGPVTWADLRTGPFPVGPATVGLLAAGFWPPEVAALGVGDVEADGSAVYFEGVAHLVPLGARPYLVAQRCLRVGDGPDAPFVTHRGHPFTAAGIATTASAALAAAGFAISPAAFSRPRTPSLRWLAARGLALRPAAVTCEPIRMARRCQHGLPGEFMVEGVLLMHSQRLCKAAGPREEIPTVVRRAASGFVVRAIERSAQGVRHVVTQSGRAAGELVGLTAPDGPLWLEVGTGRAPALETIAALVGAHYPAALGLPESVGPA